MNKVSLIRCEEYDNEKVFNALVEALKPFGGIEAFVKPHQNVVLKVNMVIKFAPERAATTHPVVVGNFAKLCMQAGANVVVADSAGGPYNANHMGALYNVTGMKKASEEFGFSLNQNFDSFEVDFKEGKVAKKFEILDVLNKADVIINVCKLKSHSFTGITNAVKNIFGVVPGLKKVQMHGQFQTLDNFSNMLYDIWDYFGNKIAFTLSDAIIGMEGEGPTNGNPRKMNAIMCSTNPVAMDIVGAKIMNVVPTDMPTIRIGIERGYLQNENDVEIVGENVENFILKDFDKRTPNMHTPFSTKVPRFIQPLLHKLTTQRPCINKKKCVGCGTCARHCPVGAITMVERKNGKKYASFDYSKCIRCFCCQELCPFGVVKVKTGIIYKFLRRKKKTKKED